MSNDRIGLLVSALALLLGCAAQEGAPAETSAVSRPGAIEDELYPAELVMDHQATLGLEEAQASALLRELASTQRELVAAEWQLRREREALSTVLAAERVDEEAAMQAAERVIEREGAIKRLHLRLLVRIKNHLTPEQQRALDAVRRR